MMYCLYVDNEEIETDLTREEALEMADEVMEDDPEVITRIEPMFEDEDEFDDSGYDEDEEDEEEDI